MRNRIDWIIEKDRLRKLTRFGLTDNELASFYETNPGAIESARRRYGISRVNVKRNIK